MAQDLFPLQGGCPEGRGAVGRRNPSWGNPSGALRHLPLQGRQGWVGILVSPDRGDVTGGDRGVHDGNLAL